jgi:hypothetical protein
VISIAVRWYLRYGLSYRDVEELLAERGITVDHVTIYRWVQRFTPEFIEAARPCRHVPGDRWFADETYVKVAGQWTYFYRAIDREVREQPGRGRYGRLKARLRPMRGLSAAARPGSWPRDTPSSRNCAVATTTSPPRLRAPSGSRPPSTTSHLRSEPAGIKIVLRYAQGRHNATVPPQSKRTRSNLICYGTRVISPG